MDLGRFKMLSSDLTFRFFYGVFALVVLGFYAKNIASRVKHGDLDGFTGLLIGYAFFLISPIGLLH